MNFHFYFDHSYYFKVANDKNILCTSNIWIVLHRVIKKMLGFQFHLKSHDKGLQILKNFQKFLCLKRE